MGGFEKQGEKFVSDMVKAGVTVTTVEKAFDDGTAAMLAALVRPKEIKLEVLDSKLDQLQMRLDALSSPPAVDPEGVGAQLALLQKQMAEMMQLMHEGMGRGHASTELASLVPVAEQQSAVSTA